MNSEQENKTLQFPEYEAPAQKIASDGIIEDIQGFEDIGFSIGKFILAGLGLYFGQSLFASFIQLIITQIILAMHQVPHAENISNFSAFLGGVLVLANFLIIIRKKIKPIFKEFTKGKTWVRAITYVGIMYGIIYAYSFLITILNINNTTSANQDSINLMMAFTPLLSGLYVCILAPLIEEFTFRFCLFRGIAKKNPKVALIVIACIFGGIHLLASIATGTLREDLVTLPVYLVGGVGLTYAYYREKRIGVSICAHFIYNTISFVMNLLMTMLIL